MRLPRVRFTVRRMMAAVAIAGLVFGCVVSLQRRAAFRRLADLREINHRYHDKRADQEEREAAKLIAQAERLAQWREDPNLASSLTIPPEDLAARRAEYTAKAQAALEYAARLRERAAWGRPLVPKYRRAARYPWLPVEPDPPEPTSEASQ